MLLGSPPGGSGLLADGAVGVFGWVPPVPPPVLVAPTELGVRSWEVSSGGPSGGRTGGALPGAEDGGSGGGWDCGVPAGSGSGVGGILGACKEEQRPRVRQGRGDRLASPAGVC